MITEDEFQAKKAELLEESVVADAPEGWSRLVDDVERWVVPTWVTNAREYGNQPWIRLVLLVDAHAMLCAPAADGEDRDDDGRPRGRSGARRRARGMGGACRTDEGRPPGGRRALVDRAESVLPEDLIVYFSRSVEPTAHFHYRPRTTVN